MRGLMLLGGGEAAGRGGLVMESVWLVVTDSSID